MNSTKKDGVATPDPMAGGHSAKRTHRMPMVVLFNIVDISALNAMNIWLKFQTTLYQKETLIAMEEIDFNSY